MSVELEKAGPQYWSRFSVSQLEEVRRNLQHDLEIGCIRGGDTQRWLDEIKAVLDRKSA